MNKDHSQAVVSKYSTKGFFWLLLISVAFTLVYYPVLMQLVTTWYQSEDNSHGFFIVPIALYIVWTKREQLSLVAVRPSNWGLLLFISSLIMYIGSYFAGIVTLSSFSIIPVWAGIVMYLFGLAYFNVLAFPFLLLFFMIPIPAQIYSLLTVPLQLLVSQVSAGIVSFMGIPLFREGNVIHLPERTLEVVQACSGLRSLLTLLTLSIILAYFSLSSNLLRTLLFLSAIPLAILVNIVRVVLIIIFLLFIEIDLTSEQLHLWFGMGIFLLALVLLFLEKGLLSKWDRKVQEEA